MLTDVACSSARDRVALIRDAMRDADAAIARTIRALGSGGGVAAATGLPAERVVELEGRCMGADARMLATCAAEQANLPRLFDAFDRRLVSWSQVRWIVLALVRVPVALRRAIDAEVVGVHAEALGDAEPDRLVELVDDQIMRRLPAYARKREKRQAEAEFVAFQPRIGGGVSLYGELGAVSAATVLEALDAAADPPAGRACPLPHEQHDPDMGAEVCDHERDARTRAQQHADALIRISEQTLNASAGSAGGGGAGSAGRPRPRVYAVLDVDQWNGEQPDAAMRLFWNLAGRRPRLTRVAAGELLCDATIVPMIRRDGRITHVGDEAPRFSRKTRRAIAARDQGCRAPGCRMPAAQTDIHHIVPGYGDSADDGVLHCRQDHRRAHAQGWKIRLLDGGVLQYTIGGKTYLSQPP